MSVEVCVGTQACLTEAIDCKVGGSTACLTRPNRDNYITFLLIDNTNTSSVTQGTHDLFYIPSEARECMHTLCTIIPNSAKGQAHIDLM